MDNIDSRTLPVEARNERCLRAVKMRLERVCVKETATQGELSPTVVIAALKAFDTGGWTAVVVHRPRRPAGTGRRLSAEQEREVRRLIRNRTPDPLKVVNAPWTREAAVELIRDRFGLKLPLRTMGLPLERWACRPQKPTCKACRQLPAAV